MIIQIAGVRAVDMVPVCEHYLRSLFCLDIGGNVFFAYEHGDMRDKHNRLVKTNPMGGRVVGVLYGNHFYPVTCKNVQERAVRRFVWSKSQFITNADTSRVHTPFVHATTKPVAEPDTALPDTTRRGKKTDRSRLFDAMTNTPFEPVCDPPMEDLLGDALQHKYVCYGLARLNRVYDFLVRSKQVPQGCLEAGTALTKWKVKKGGDRVCTQIATRTQIISCDPELALNVQLYKHYYPEQEERFNHHAGCWFRLLFDGVLKNSKNPRVPLELKRSGSCALCGILLDNGCADHVHALARGGTNEPDNLQLLCGPCNTSKGTKLQGIRLDGKPILVPHRLESLQSEFAVDVWSQMVRPQFRTNRAYKTLQEVEAIRRDGGLVVHGMDCKKQYSTCLYTADHRWPRFSLFDRPEPFDILREEIVTGYYYVTEITDFGDPSWEGAAHYPAPWVWYHFHMTGLLRPRAVRTVIRASFSFDPKIFQPVVEELYSHPDYLKEYGKSCSVGKVTCNLAVGNFEKMETTGQSGHILTSDLEEMKHYALMYASYATSKDSGVWIGQSCREDMKEYYELFSRRGSECYRHHAPISDWVRCYSALWASRMYHQYFKDGSLIGIYRDQFIFYEQGQSNRMLTTFTKKAPFEFQWCEEAVSWDKIRGIWSPIPPYPPPGFATKTLQTFVEDSDDFRDDLERRILAGASVFLNGDAGTGKTWFLREIITKMREEISGKVVVCLAPTNAAARNIGTDARTLHKHFGLGGDDVLCTQHRNRSAHPDVYWIDEASMLDARLWGALYTAWRMFPDIQFIVTGDSNQCPPFEDDLEKAPNPFGARGETTIINDTPFIKSLFDVWVTFEKCHRSVCTEWRSICKTLIAGEPWRPAEAVGVTHLEHLLRSHKGPLVVSYTNKTRKLVNDQCADLWRKLFPEKELLPYYKRARRRKDRLQSFQFCVGMPLVAVKTTDKWAKNEWATLDAFENEKENENEKEKEKEGHVTVGGHVIPLDEFFTMFAPAFAITTHAAQGMTFDWPYLVADWDWMDRYLRYTAFSRSRRVEQVKELIL